MDYLYSKILGNYLKKNYNNWYSRVPEKSFSFEGGARYCITRGPMLGHGPPPTWRTKPERERESTEFLRKP